jgi:putative aldouronate transport system substrate-binding protein
MHNWDYPYRGDTGIHAALQTISVDAAYIAIDPFQNDAGAYRKYLSPPVDRKIFLPSTNTEPLASLLYLNWISKLENRRYLQIGDPDVDHTVLSDDSIAWIRQTGERIMNSGMNIDYTITLNGLDLGDATRTILSIANSYPGVDKRFISASYFLQSKDVRRIPLCFNRVGASESALRSALQSICQTLLTQALTAALENFDAVFNAGLQGYLDAGGQTIIDERRAIYQATH